MKRETFALRKRAHMTIVMAGAEAAAAFNSVASWSDFSGAFGVTG